MAVWWKDEVLRGNIREYVLKLKRTTDLTHKQMAHSVWIIYGVRISPHWVGIRLKEYRLGKPDKSSSCAGDSISDAQALEILERDYRPGDRHNYDQRRSSLASDAILRC